MCKCKSLRSAVLVVSILVFGIPLLAGQAPKNIILLIGDGMGVGQVSLARITVQAEGKVLAMDSMRIGGIVQTRSANAIVTDSAAAGTALATGWKTNNGMVSMSADDSPVETILEAAQSLNKSAGLVTTTNITDATPAVFASHVDARAQQPEIAGQMLAHKVDVMMGGGRANFIPQSQAGSNRKDDADLLSQAKRNGYEVVTTRDEVARQTTALRLLGLFELGDLTTVAPEPSLEEMAAKAIEILTRNRRGFFLMIEGGHIDKRAHVNDAEGVVKQMRDFDQTIAVVLAFARKQKDTLVIVTADHETGGLAVMPAPRGSQAPWTVAWTTKGHTGNTVPLLAEGPGATEFGGVMDNTDVAKRMASVWKVKDFPRKQPAASAKQLIPVAIQLVPGDIAVGK